MPHLIRNRPCIHSNRFTGCLLTANIFAYEIYVQLNAERYMTSLADGFADSNRKMHLLRSCLNTTALDEAFNGACCNQTEAAVTYGKTRKWTAGECSLRLHRT
jgi:hypothetical protein